MSSTSSITMHDLSYEWPDGTLALSRLNGSFSANRTGLIGRNGAGKSTLLRLIAGILTPTDGSVTTSGDVSYLSQDIVRSSSESVARLLGIEAKVKALRAIENGDIAQDNFDIVGDDWDIEARAEQMIHELGLGALELERSVERLSGGETMILAIAGQRLRRSPITLLDEPTNNLDRPSRAKLSNFVREWPGTLVVVSHDLELLETMDSTAELYAGEFSTVGGPYSMWKARRDQEDLAAEQAARSARQSLKAEKKERQDAEIKLARRARTAKQTQQSGGIPKILAGNRASRAQQSAAGLRSTLDRGVADAQARLDAADQRLRDREHINITLPDPEVPSSRRLAEIDSAGRTFVLQGPERVALVGANGSGKSTLLKQMVRNAEPDPGRAHGRLLSDRVGYLSQRLDELLNEESAIDSVRTVAPDASDDAIRNQLARLLLRGDSVYRQIRDLSGGERFRVALARLLLAEPPPQLLVLDEPTNNLDIDSVEQLAEALDAYRGALLVVSHDYDFLRRIGVATVLELNAEGSLVERAQLGD